MFQYLWLCGFRFIAHQCFSAFSCQRILTRYAKSYMTNHSQNTGTVSVLNTLRNKHKKNRKRALKICRLFPCHFCFKQYLLSHELDLITYALMSRNITPCVICAMWSSNLIMPQTFLEKNIFAPPFAFDKSGHDKTKTLRGKIVARRFGASLFTDSINFATYAKQTEKV